VIGFVGVEVRSLFDGGIGDQVLWVRGDRCLMWGNRRSGFVSVEGANAV